MTQVVQIYITTTVQVEPVRKKDEFTELCNLLRPFILTKCNKIELRGIDCSGKFFFRFRFLKWWKIHYDNFKYLRGLPEHCFKHNVQVQAKLLLNANLCKSLLPSASGTLSTSSLGHLNIESALIVCSVFNILVIFINFFFQTKSACPRLLLVSAITLHTVIVHLVRMQNFPKN